MSSSWIIDGRGLSRKVKNVSAQTSSQIKDSGAKLECPYCHQIIDNSHVTEDWPGLPVGVKFDPSDLDLLEHLAKKSGIGNSKPHLFIDEFIPTLEGDEGICCTHPENLPGAKKDGSSIHFFYRTFNAYATGRRKRRKIQDEEGLVKEAVRWHKTGKTKTLFENGVPKGYKKIMVLYSSSKNGKKADKCSWVMHQYHLGADEDEKEGEYVVCKIFYQQPKQTESNETFVLAEGFDSGPSRSPTTPKITTPQQFLEEEMDFFRWDGQEDYSSLAGESQAIEENDISGSLYNDIFLDAQIRETQPTEGNGVGDFLLCNEMIDPWENSSSGLNFEFPTDQSLPGYCNAPCSIADLGNLELDTPSNPADLIISSQDSLLGFYGWQ